MSMGLTYDDAWTDLVGRCFVLGMPNAKGEKAAWLYLYFICQLHWVISRL